MWKINCSSIFSFENSRGLKKFLTFFVDVTATFSSSASYGLFFGFYLSQDQGCQMDFLRKRIFWSKKRNFIKKRGFLRINKYFFKASLFSELWLPLPNDLMYPVKQQTFCFSVHPKIVVWILGACGADRRRRRKFFQIRPILLHLKSIFWKTLTAKI